MLKFTLNGTDVAVDAPPNAPLLFVLNNDLDQHGAKFGCGLSQCGACTVLIDGEPVRSCQTAAQTAVGRSVTTLAGPAMPLRIRPRLFGITQLTTFRIERIFCTQTIIKFVCVM